MATLTVYPNKTPTDSYSATVDNYDNIWGANWGSQTFTPAVSNTITKVKLNLQKKGTPAGNFVVSVQATTAGKPNGTELCTGNIANSTITADVDAEYEITLGAGASLIASTIYGIVVNAIDGTSDIVCIRFNGRTADGSGAYTDGAWYESSDSGANWGADVGGDHLFAVYGNTVDGTVTRRQADETWATIRTSNGNYAWDTDPSDYCGINTSATQDQWESILRDILILDVSGFAGLPDNITGITFNIYVNNKSDAFTDSISLVNATPAANNDLVVGDYLQLGTTLYATAKAISGISTAQYNVFTLNAAGIAAVKAAIAGDGIVKLGLVSEKDRTNSEPAWQSVAGSQINYASADYAGTDRDPYLEITYTTDVLIQPPAMNLNIAMPLPTILPKVILTPPAFLVNIAMGIPSVIIKTIISVPAFLINIIMGIPTIFPFRADASKGLKRGKEVLQKTGKLLKYKMGKETSPRTGKQKKYPQGKEIPIKTGKIKY